MYLDTIEKNRKYTFLNKYAFLKTPKTIMIPFYAILIMNIVCSYSYSNRVFYPLVLKQCISVFISIIIFHIIVSININIIRRFAYVFIVISFLSLIAVILFGKHIMGASRWLNFGFISVQPSEFTKIAIILAVSKFLGNISIKKIYRISSTFITFSLIAPILILIAKQPDLATAVIIFITVVIMLFSVGKPKIEFIFAAIASCIVAPITWIKFLKDYQKLRIINFIFPNNDPLSSGYSVIQSKIAIGSGGLFGKGYLNGTQGKMNFLPENRTDFIFSIFSEEFGFFIELILIFCYLSIVLYGLHASNKTNSIFCKLTAIGCSSLIFFHVFVNIGMTIGLLPVVGIPLIMMSYGGSSLLTGVICVALIVNIGVNKNNV